MKNILKIAVSFLFGIVLFSCTNDKDNVASANGFQLRKVASVISPDVLLNENDGQDYAVFEWDRSNNGVASASTYVVVVSDHADPNLEHAVESTVGLVLTADARRDSLSVGDFNDLINKLPSFNCNQMNIDIRVKSKLGVSTNAYFQYSNPITVTVTGYSKALPILAFARDSDSPATSSKIAASDFQTFSDYQGYMYLEPGSYRLYKPDPCGDFAGATVYGISGGNAGTLSQNGATGYLVTTAGFYLVKANITAGTYGITPFTNFAIFGAATGQATFINTPMVYDAANKKFKLTFDLLKAKKFKFKLLNGTSAATPLNILGGTASACVENGTDITVPGSASDIITTQKYDIVLDVSKPRSYTYTLTPNPN
jgi:starch-binding outer membrane protein SusE/F